MRKKSILFLLLVSLVLFTTPIATLAQSNSSTNNVTQNASQIINPRDKIDRVGEIIENIGSEEERTEYLKEAWSKILEKTTLGKVLKAIEKVFQYLDPVFNIIFGIGFTLSQIFLLVFIIYIVLIKIFWNFSTLVELYAEGDKINYIKGTLIAGWVILISSIRIPKKIATSFVDNIAKIDSLFGQIVFLIIICVLLFSLIPLFGKIKSAIRDLLLRKNAAEGKKESKKNKEEIKLIEAENTEEKKAKKENRDLKKMAEEELEGIDEV